MGFFSQIKPVSYQVFALKNTQGKFRIVDFATFVVCGSMIWEPKLHLAVIVFSFPWARSTFRFGLL